MLFRVLMLVSLLLSASFAFADQKLDGIVAVVNEDVITTTELKAAVDQFKNNMAKRDVQLPSDKVIRDQSLERLINIKLQEQVANKAGVSVTESEVDHAITDIAKRNHLSKEILAQKLEEENMTMKQYRKTIHQEMLVARVQQQALAKQIKITPDEINQYMKKQQDKNASNASIHLIDIALLFADDSPSGETAKAFEQEATTICNALKEGKDAETLTKTHKNLTKTDLGWRKISDLPTAFSTAAADMKLNSFHTPLSLGNGYHILQLVGRRDAEKRNVVTESHVAHILIKTKMHDNDEGLADADAKHMIESVRKQITDDASFKRLAKTYSDDTLSAEKGGDLGWITGAQVVPAFRDAMNALKLNTLSQPIKSRFGWHLIKVYERKQTDKTAELARRKATNALYQARFKDEVGNWIQKLRGQAYVKILS